MRRLFIRCSRLRSQATPATSGLLAAGALNKGFSDHHSHLHSQRGGNARCDPYRGATRTFDARAIAEAMLNIDEEDDGKKRRLGD